MVSDYSVRLTSQSELIVHDDWKECFTNYKNLDQRPLRFAQERMETLLIL